MEEKDFIDDMIDEEDEELDAGEAPEAEEPEDAGEGEDSESDTADDEGDEQPDRVAELEALLASEREKSGKSDADLKRLLKALGYEDADSYLAEQEGISREAYVEKKRDEEILAQAKAQAANAKYDKMIADDLAALKSAGLIDSTVTDLRSIDNVKRFAELRDMGLSAEEAYRAAAGSKLDTRIEQGARRAASGKEHLTTPKSRGTSGHGSVMSRREFEYYSELLGTTDRKAIESAYKRATAQQS